MKLRKLDKNFKIAIMALILTIIAACIFGGFTLLISKTKLKLFNNGIVNNLIIIHVIVKIIIIIILYLYILKEKNLSKEVA